MPSQDSALGIVFVSQMGAGILGNTFLFGHYVSIYCSGQRLRNIDFIIMNLIFANCLGLFSRGIPQTLQTFGTKYFPDDFGCKLIFYIHRVSRGVSLGTTALLSGFQGITINTTHPWWVRLKVRNLKYIGISIILCWSFNLLINISVPMYVTNKTWNQESRNITETTDLVYCYGLLYNSHISIMHLVIFSSTDVLYLGFMVWASGSMVLILHRHKQNVTYIHSKTHRATHSILILVSTFFSTYSLSSLVTFYMSCFDKPNQLLVNVSALIASCFPTLSPIVLLSGDPRIYRRCFACWARTK